MVAVMGLTFTGIAQAITACEAAEKASLEITNNVGARKYKDWSTDQIVAEWRQIKEKWKNQVTSGNEFERAMDLYFQWVGEGMKKDDILPLQRALKQGCPNNFD